MEDKASTLERKIEDLRRELVQAKTERDTQNFEAQKWAEQRDRIHSDLKEMFSKLAELKAKRNIISERIRTLESSLLENRETYREKKTQVQNLNQRSKGFKSKGYRLNGQNLEEKIKEIDWRIQTNPLPMDEEKMLVEQVKNLESQLVIHKQATKLKDKMGSLKEAMSAADSEISNLIDRRRKLQEEIRGPSSRISELKAEADKMHKKYLEHRTEAQRFHQKYVEILTEMKGLQQELAKIEEERKTKRTLELKSDLEKKASEKLKNHKKLTFEEFKILAEGGKI